MAWPRRLLFALFLGAFVGLQWSPLLPDVEVSDKIAHVLLYYAFALFLWPELPSTDPLPRAGAVVSIGFLVGLTMEAGQVHFPGRTPDSTDALADLAGLLMASIPMAWAGMNPVSASPTAKA